LKWNDLCRASALRPRMVSHYNPGRRAHHEDGQAALAQRRRSRRRAGWCNLAIDFSGLLPLALDESPDGAACEFYVGSDPAKLSNPAVNLQAYLRGLDEGDEIALFLNGHPLDVVRGGDGPYKDIAVQPGQLRYRKNRLRVKFRRDRSAAQKPAELVHLELTVQPTGAEGDSQ